jgi:hypothetical protein
MRCYNGCPDSALQALLDAKRKAHEELRAVDPGARATYFPVEEEWSVWKDNRQIGSSSPSLFAAINNAITILKKQKDDSDGC